METSSLRRHHGPHPGILAIVFALLFIAGLSFALSGKGANFPSPWVTQAVLEDYFQHHQREVLFCGFLQFASAVPLGLLTASLSSRLRFLGNVSTGPYIALFGGFWTVVDMAFCGLLLWAMAYPGVVDNGPVLRMLYYVGFAIGGVGYSVPLGLLVAGTAVSAGFMRVLPRWLVVSGVVVAVVGESSVLSLVIPKLVPLIPLTRFPGFIWLIFVGFKLPARAA
jgi:hypothetical protein